MADLNIMALYTDAYLADTTHLSTEEHGAYLMLLIAMWRAGGKLSDDPAFLQRVTKVSAKRWPRVWKMIGLFFAHEGDCITSLRIGRYCGRRPLSAELRQAVVARDGLVCRYCGSKYGPHEIDHVHPVIRGGSNTVDNLAVACLSCNRRKGSLSLEEWCQ